MTLHTQILRWLDPCPLTIKQLRQRIPSPPKQIRAALAILDALGCVEVIRYRSVKLYRRVA